MTRKPTNGIGIVQSLWRYPVKSMRGEELSYADVHHFGLLGDRLYAVLDCSDGKVATAKNPQKWPSLLACQATLLDQPGSPCVRITLPDGQEVTSEQEHLAQVLSKIFNREVTLAQTQGGSVSGVPPGLASSWIPQSEEYWPDIEGRDKRETVTEFSLPPGTFFDGAMVHVLTTATLNQLRACYPGGRFEVPRFRPNIVVDTGHAPQGFLENDWIEQTLAIGDEVRLKVTTGCGRCVMTTLPQGDLPKDSGILRSAVRHNEGYVGIYASVVHGGAVRPGDAVRIV